MSEPNTQQITKTKKKIRPQVFYTLFLLLLIGLGVIFLLNQPKPVDLNKETIQADNLPNAPIQVVEPEPYDFEALKKTWTDNKKISDDYVGQIIFDSGLINEPIVQGLTNETYITTDWITGSFDYEGSNFLDADDELTDKNMTVYGHYVYANLDPTRTHKFTQLAKLREEKNYEDNKYLIFVLEDEIRKYEIASVFDCQLTADENGDFGYIASDTLQYFWRNIGDEYINYNDYSISEEYFNDFTQEVKSLEHYDTGVEYSSKDNFLTFQTCIENRDDLREVVICKEIEIMEMPKK